MSHASSSMPPLTEGAAEALAKKANQPLKGSSAAEVPMAFLNRPAKRLPVANAGSSENGFRLFRWLTVFAALAAFLTTLWILA